MNNKQRAKLLDLQAAEHRALFDKSSSRCTQSIPNNNSPSRASDKESLIQDYQMQQEVNYVITKAMQTFNKGSERDLSLVQILKQFEQIVEEDANNADQADIDPQINPLQRSKIYLQLLKYKKAQELKELEEINDSIEKYKSTRTSKNHGTVNSSTEVKTSDGREQYLMSKAQAAALAQRQPKSKRSVTSTDCQMIPENQRPNKPSNESSKVSLKLLRKDNEGSIGSESTNLHNQQQQISQVYLKGVGSKQQEDRIRPIEDQERSAQKMLNSGSAEQLIHSGNYSVPMDAVEREVQMINNRNVPKKDQYVTFSQDEDLLQQSLQQNLKRDYQGSALEQIDEGQEEMQQQNSAGRQTTQSDTQKFSIGYEKNFDTYQMNIYKRAQPPKGGSKTLRVQSNSNSQHSEKQRKKSDSHSRGRTHSYAWNASSNSSKQCRKLMTKKPSAELLPKKKYVSLRPGRYSKFVELTRNVLHSPNGDKRSDNLVTEPPVKSVNHRDHNGSRQNSYKSHERTPSLHKSKSRSIGKRNLSRQNDSQRNKTGSRSPHIAGPSFAQKRNKFNNHRSPVVRQSLVKSTISSKSRENNSIERSYNQHLSSSSVPFSNNKQKMEQFRKFQSQFAGNIEWSSPAGEDLSRLHYFNKLQANLKNQLDFEFQNNKSVHPSLNQEAQHPDQSVISKADLSNIHNNRQVFSSHHAVEKGGAPLLSSSAKQEDPVNRTEIMMQKRVPNKDLLSIRSQVNQTINSVSSPTERYEIDQGIRREANNSSKISRQRKSALNDQGSQIKNIAEFSENEERSRWEVVCVSQSNQSDNKDYMKRKHNFNPQLQNSNDALQLNRVQPRAGGYTPTKSSRSQVRSRSPHSQRSRTSQTRQDVLQASSSTVMHSPLIPERKRQPVSAREQAEQQAPYHVRSQAVQKQIREFIGQEESSTAIRNENPNRDRASASSLSKQGGKGLLKQGDWPQQSKATQAQQPQLIGDSSINQFKMFVMDQMKEDQRDTSQDLVIVDQTQDLNDRENAESDDEDAFKLQKVPITRKKNQYEQDAISLSKGQQPRKVGELEQSNMNETSQMLVHALHYEMNLIRKAFQVIQANSLINQTQRLNYKISKSRYLKSLKTKALRAIHMNYLNHFGHRNANQQAATLSKYLISRKYLTTWMSEFQRRVRHRAAIEEMRTRMSDRTKMNVFVEWQQLQLMHQLYKVQKETATTFWRNQAIKKSFLSLKFFTQFTLKRNRMQSIAFEHIKHRLLIKSVIALKHNIQVQAQKKERIKIAFRTYDNNLERRAFKYLQIACMESLIERINRKKARDFLIQKLLRICWNHWRIYRIESEKERLNAKLGREFRDQMLMRTLFNNLHIATKILREVYSPDKVFAIITRNRMRHCFRYLKVNKDMKVAIVGQLPKRLSFYYYANTWIQDYNLTKYSLNPQSVLVNNFESKTRQYYLIKCFYTLYSTYEQVRQMKDKRNLEVKIKTFNMLRRHHLKKAAGKYKQEIVNEKIDYQKQARIFYVMKLFTQKRAHCKKIQSYLHAARRDKLRVKIFDEWNKLYIARQLKQQQKVISIKMNRDRYVTTFFRAWMQKYNKSQKKKFLNEIQQYYRRERVRNKIFTLWMQKVTTSIDAQLRERQAAFSFQEKRMQQVMQALKVHSIRRKREHLITQIIKEKNDSIIAIKVIELWRRRLHERMEKHQLYDQVVHDRQMRIKDIVFWTLKLNVEESKEQMVQEMAARRESETQMSQTESQRTMLQEMA